MCTAMPEATVDENGHSKTGKSEIWIAVQLGLNVPTPKTVSREKRPQPLFCGAIAARLDASHVSAASFFANAVHLSVRQLLSRIFFSSTSSNSSRDGIGV